MTPLEIFYKEYTSIRVLVERDCLIYKTIQRLHYRELDEVKNLIHKLRLPLVAESNSINGQFMDSFIIKNK